MFCHGEERSNTVVNPYRVRKSWSCRISSAAGIAAALAHFRSKKWTWLLQKPAVIVSPAQLTTSVSGGTVAPLAAATFPSWMKTMPSRMGSASGVT